MRCLRKHRRVCAIHHDVSRAVRPTESEVCKVAHDQAAAPWPIVPSAPSPWRDQEIGGSQRSLGGGWRGALSARAALQSTTSACVQPVLACTLSSGQLALRTQIAEDASSVISQCYGCKGRESGEAAQVYGAAGVAPLQQVECRWK